MSTDGTRERLRQRMELCPRVSMVDNPPRLQSAGMNAILRRARGEVIVRMDVHCEYAPDYVRRCVEELERTGADNVGGAQRAGANNAFQAAVCAALRSRLGAGGARYRSEQAEGFVDTVFLGAFRRKVFETAGLYDEGAITNEDAELNERIRAGGGRIYLSRRIVSHYSPRESARALARQYFRYGSGRARTLLKHLRLTPLRPAIPVVGAMTMLFGLAWPPLRSYASVALGLYGLSCLGEAVRHGRKLGVKGTLTVAAVFPILHTAHASGFVVGFVRYLLSPDWGPPERLPPRAGD